MSHPDRESLRVSICRYLAKHTTLSLATCHDNQAWAADLFYASDEGCRLYFVSSATSRHCRHIAANPRVAVSISGEYTDWGTIKGLQLDGVARVVAEADRAGVIEGYLAKFPALQELQRNPKNEQESQIAKRLLESDFYRISPKWIRLIDNRKGFGHKEEILF